MSKWDGAYDEKQCRQVISDRQTHAIIPPLKILSLGKLKE